MAGPDSQLVAPEPSPAVRQQLTGWRLYLLGLALGLANLMMALDVSIMAPALPAITSEFRTVDDIGWYSSVYLLVQMSCQPVFGRLLQYYEPKMFYMASLIVFEVGSVVCATSPSSVALVLGRAVAGAGAAGIVTGSLAIFGDTAPLRERPRGMAVIAALQSVAYLAGPIVSGALTDSRLTWRFNFWINLPVGFVSFVTVFFVIARRPSPKADTPLAKKLWGVDPGGAVILTSSFVCLFLALEWGGNVLPFSSSQVWGTFLGFGLLAICFAGWEAWRKDDAIIPLRILHQRTVAVCCAFSFLYALASITFSMLLPTYFQTVHAASATQSGLYYMPTTLLSVLGILVTGFSVTAWRYYTPFLHLGPLLFLAGSVLFHRLTPHSAQAEYLGYQVLTGLGFGLSIHVSMIAVQVVSLPGDMPTACVTELLCGQLGGAVGASVAQSVFLSQLRTELGRVVPGEEAGRFADGGLEAMVEGMKGMEEGVREGFRWALNDAVTMAFVVPIAATVAAEVVSWFVEQRRLEEETERLADSSPPATGREDVEAAEEMKTRG